MTHYFNEEESMEVLVFKTNIHSPEVKPLIAQQLMQLKGVSRWSIDFGDRDKVLRVEAEQTHPSDILRLVTSAGFVCEELV
jgi:hypothetical protein